MVHAGINLHEVTALYFMNNPNTQNLCHMIWVMDNWKNQQSKSLLLCKWSYHYPDIS